MAERTEDFDFCPRLEKACGLPGQCLCGWTGNPTQAPVRPGGDEGRCVPWWKHREGLRDAECRVPGLWVTWAGRTRVRPRPRPVLNLNWMGRVSSQAFYFLSVRWVESSRSHFFFTRLGSGVPGGRT